MAQHKYDMLTVPTVLEGPRRHHPWYKERLRLKFLNPSKQAAALNGQKWTFVANDIDDFRSGVPSKTNSKMMMKHGPPVNTLPLVSTGSRTSQKSNCRITPQPEPRIITNNPGLRTLYSKVGPRKQVQQERVEREKSVLLKHPLQLYPHLEDSIPVELLDGVLEVIDPQLKNNDTNSSEGSSSDTDSLSSISSQQYENAESEVFSTTQPLENSDKPKPQQAKLYKFPLKKTREEKERERMIVASQQVISASQQSRVDQVTHDLVQWMENMGGSEGDQYNMDESMIKSLFSSDYESKPVLVAPIHVVELVNVPAELRLESREHSRSGYSSSPSLKYATPDLYRYGRTRTKGFTYPGNDFEEPRYIKSKYGAWYLPVDLWRPRKEDEPLRDPKAVAADMECEDAQKGIAVEEMLCELHGARAFKEFVLTKRRGSVMPNFLERVNLNSSNTQPRKQPVKPK